MKDLYQKYRPDELPPQPERYYNLNEEDEITEGGNTDDTETEEKAEPTTDAATDGIDLRLVKRGGSSDNVSDPGDIIINNDPSGEVVKEDETGSCAVESESTISEEAEGDGADEDAETYVEAVQVIDTELSDTDDNRNQHFVQETLETVPDEDVPEDVGIADENEIEIIFGEDESDEVSENPELTLADLFDDFSDEDYREESEEEQVEIEDAESTDEELVEENMEDTVEAADSEIIDEELVEEEQEEIETEETETVEEKYDAEAEETEPTEQGGEENSSRLFPEGYNPTIAELRAALRALSS